MDSLGRSFARLRLDKFHGEPAFPLALTPRIEADMGIGGHDFSTLIDQKA
jgi:hypothetical protein